MLAGWSRRGRGESALTSHGVEALLFERGSYIVRVRAATGEFLAQTASARQIQGGAKLMARQPGQEYGVRPGGTCSHLRGSAPLLVGYLIAAMARTSLG
jgi:hypothetical protein